MVSCVRNKSCQTAETAVQPIPLFPRSLILICHSCVYAGRLPQIEACVLEPIQMARISYFAFNTLVPVGCQTATIKLVTGFEI